MSARTDRCLTGAQPFAALENALEVIRSLRPIVPVIRRHSRRLADQIVDASNSVVANVAEGNRRRGRDRLHFFNIAAGSAAETQAHLLAALAWAWVRERDLDRTFSLLDRELALLWGLTH